MSSFKPKIYQVGSDIVKYEVRTCDEGIARCHVEGLKDVVAVIKGLLGGMGALVTFQKGISIATSMVSLKCLDAWAWRLSFAIVVDGRSLPCRRPGSKDGAIFGLSLGVKRFGGVLGRPWRHHFPRKISAGNNDLFGKKIRK